MKLLLALLMTVASFTAYSQGTYDAVGTVKTREAIFKPFVNGAAGALTVGMVVCLDLTDDNGIAVDYCAGEGFKPVGVITDTSCAVGARCKVQTKGYFAYGRFDYLATATIAGGMVYADTDGDIVRPATVLVSHSPLGVSLDAVAADATTLEIFIDLQLLSGGRFGAHS